MKTNTIALLAGALMLTAFAKADPSTFDLTYQFTDGPSVFASFTGTANGDVISDLTLNAITLNGVSFVQPEDGYPTVTAYGTISFDGLQNAFTFENGSSTVAGYPPIAYFGGFNGVGSGATFIDGADAYDAVINDSWSIVDPPSLQADSQSVPEGGSVLGFLLIAIPGFATLALGLKKYPCTP
jgi:hypothetical protein